MRKLLTSLILCLVVIQSSYSQNEPIQDTIPAENKVDSTSTKNIGQFISHQTDVIVGSLFGSSRQLSNADSIINKFDALPSFGIYKDNYFIVGTNLFEKPTDMNSDAKFQVSIRHRLTNSTLPFKTYFFLTYTQKAFWNVFQESFPFRDLNFNPTLGLGRALVRDNRFLGTISFQFEHESNGKDGEDSRSWNKISFGAYLAFNDRWTFHTKAWIPLVDGGNNKDIVRYSGWGLIGMDYSSPKKKYNAGLLITKRGGVNLNANIIANFSIRLFNDDNQYLFLEYYNGYGESMLDYKQYRQRLRLGIVIKPSFISLY
ncbi:MAG: phospholipase A [Prevotella sp.]|jgi:phospholipase A1|nr:phospholipase A [Prevotella sp.]